MRGFDRYQTCSLVLMAMVVVVTLVFVSLRQALLGFAPDGVNPSAHFASLDVRADGAEPSGAPLALVEAAHALPGVRGAYAARATRFVVATTDMRREVGVAFVTRHYFSSLQVPLRGGGFTHRHDRERPGIRECIVSRVLAAELGGADAALGMTLAVDDGTCVVVASVDNAFAGLRIRRRQDLWLAWPGALGLTVPAVAPDDFFERTQLATEAGLQLDGTRDLTAIERDLAAIAVASDTGSAVTLSHGEGIDAQERKEAVAQVSLLWLATVNFIGIGAAFLIAMAVWRVERRVGEMVVRSALGAPACRLVRAAIVDAVVPLLVGAVIAVPLGMGLYRLLVRWSGFDAVRVILSPWPSVAGYAVAATTVLLVGTICAAAGVRGVLRAGASRRSGAHAALARSKRSSTVERGTVFAIVGIAVFSVCLAASLWTEQHLRQQRDMGYAGSHITAFSLQRPTSIEEYQRYLPPDAPVSALKRGLEDIVGAGRVALAESVPFRTVLHTRPVLAWDMADTDVAPQVEINDVDEDFLRVLGVAFVEGRGFTAANDEVVLSRSAAMAYLGPPPWTGRAVRFRTAIGVAPRQVVGVVEDVRYGGRDAEPSTTIYRRLESLASVSSVLVDVPGSNLPIASVETLLRDAGLQAPLLPIVSLGQLEYRDAAVQRMRSRVVIGASAAGLILGVVGLGWILSVLVLKRTQELAIRSALGARSARLLGELLRTTSWAAALALFGGAIMFELVRRAALGTTVLQGLGTAQWLACIGAVLAVFVLACLPPWQRLLRLPLAQVLKSE